jgi:hypothetical protein
MQVATLGRPVSMPNSFPVQAFGNLGGVSCGEVLLPCCQGTDTTPHATPHQMPLYRLFGCHVQTCCTGVNMLLLSTSDVHYLWKTKCTISGQLSTLHIINNVRGTHQDCVQGMAAPFEHPNMRQQQVLPDLTRYKEWYCIPITMFDTVQPNPNWNY